MSSKINISGIVRDHFATLVNERTGKLSRVDLISFFGIPIVFGIVSFILRFKLDGAEVTVLIAALAIFSGLLVNVLVLIYSLAEGVTKDNNQDDGAKSRGIRFLREVFANLSFAILIALLCIVLLSLIVFATDMWARLLTAAFVACCLNFLMTFLMALKRIHVLLRNRFPQ